MSDFELNAERPDDLSGQASDNALADHLEHAGRSTDADTPASANDTQPLGWLAKTIAVPLAPIVIGWDLARAFVTKAIPAAARASWRAIVAPFRAVRQLVGRMFRGLITGLDQLGLAIMRGITAALRAVAAPFRASWRGLRSALSHVLAVVDRVFVALGRFGSTVAAGALRGIRVIGQTAAAPFRALWRGVQSALRYISTAVVRAFAALRRLSATVATEVIAFGRTVGQALATPFRYVAGVARRFTVVVREFARASLLTIKQLGRATTALAKRILIPIRETLRATLHAVKQLGRATTALAKRILIPIRETLRATLHAVKQLGRATTALAKRILIPIRETLRATLHAVKQLARATTALAKRILIPIRETLRAFVVFIAHTGRAIGRALTAPLRLATDAITSAVKAANRYGRNLIRIADSAIAAASAALARVIVAVSQVARRIASTIAQPLRYVGRAARQALVASVKIGRSIGSAAISFAQTLTRPITWLAEMTRTATAATVRALRNVGHAIRRPMVAAVASARQLAGSIISATKNVARRIAAPVASSVRATRVTLRNARVAIAGPIRATRASVRSMKDSVQTSARAVRASTRRTVQDLRKTLRLGNTPDTPQWIEPKRHGSDQPADVPLPQHVPEPASPTAGVRLPSTPSLAERLQAKSAEVSVDASVEEPETF